MINLSRIVHIKPGVELGQSSHVVDVKFQLS